jgi:signal transduction histidine kinase
MSAMSCVRTILPLRVLAIPLYNSHSHMRNRYSFGSQLSEISQLTDTRWSAWITYLSGDWIIQSAYQLKNPSKKKLQGYLNSPAIKKWIKGTLADQRIRPRLVASSVGMNSNRLYLFPMQDELNAILVGVDNLSPQSRRIWKMVSNAFAGLMISEDQTRQLQDALQELENTQQELQARIAAQQAAETRLIQTTKLAAVGEMAAGVAHELNNPLTTVVGFSELVLEALPVDTSQRSDLEVVLREARRARDVVRRLLDFSRQSETVRISADVNEVVQDVLSLMHHLFRINGVVIDAKFEDKLPWVMIDRNQMKQVFLNLLHNALNAMPEGGELSVITSLQTRYGKPHVLIAIKDTGVGIPPENLPRIFEPFFTTRAGQGGTGLGLSVTYGIVAEHGGAIEVESTLGAGSIFTVFLPIEDKS